ncbi:MAG: hypothetical protein JEY99_14795 [Spirochaetales bacterium]|nr:hypothetical protein [Spirochaetales bacterium]
MNYKKKGVLFVLIVMTLLLTGCAGFYVGVPVFNGPGPHRIGKFKFSLYPSTKDHLVLLLENNGVQPVEVNLYIINRRIGEENHSDKVRIGTDYIERCSEDESLCWLEEVPVYEERQTLEIIYSEIQPERSFLRLEPGDEAQVAFEMVNGLSVEKTFSPQLQFKVKFPEEREFFKLDFSSTLLGY